jgi:hypothetical protein
MNNFKLLMLGAMYENGGNSTHRFLDGHPQMFVYPFESQLGTSLVNDHLSSMFPAKYRWPAFALNANARQDYLAIIDEECKVRARTPQVSKFRDFKFDFSDDERRQFYEAYISEQARSRAGNVAAFFRATFDAWKDYKRTGEEVLYVGYSPAIVVDADKIFSDFSEAYVLHVVRNPWSAYADTKKRPVALSLEKYMIAWTLNQYFALLFKARFPGRMHIVRAEDVIMNPLKALGDVCDKLGLERADSLRQTTWNGTILNEVYPWGTIRKATPEANLATANELSHIERDEIRAHAWQYLEAFDYQGFI